MCGSGHGGIHLDIFICILIIDQEDQLPYGMNGTIKGTTRFQCFEGHGLVTTLANVELSEFICEFELVWSIFDFAGEEAKQPKLLENGIIDPNKFLKCEAKWDKGFLQERKIKMNDLVSIRMDNGGDMKMKGTLRWCGFINKMPVGAVEMVGTSQ